MDGISEYEAGEVIFTEDESGSCAYVVETGVVEISNLVDEQKTILGTISQGELFGEMALIDGRTRTATATAMVRTRLIVVSDHTIITRLQEADPVIRLLLTVVLTRYRSELNRRKGDRSPRNPPPRLDTSADTKSTIDSALDTIRIEGQLRQALENEEFLLHYQPIVDLKTGRIAGHEALVRWVSPERGFTSPDIFIPIAEQTPLMEPIGRWVLEEACRAQHQMTEVVRKIDPNAPPMFMSVNVSGRQFLAPNFLENVKTVIGDTGIDPSEIKLEITETMLSDPDIALVWITSCRDLGFRIALDDFGTGYSSLSYLHKFPFDTLKIDRAFVSKMLTSKENMAVVRAVMEIARGSDLDVVAEGIEEPEEFTALNELDCHYGQGFLMSRPKDLEDALEQLAGDHFARYTS